ncbi:hypothetical protein HK405_009715, partial [Cladochytrium tenue]
MSNASTVQGFDQQATRKVRDMFEKLDAFLYKETNKLDGGGPQLGQECDDWLARFPHLRLVVLAFFIPRAHARSRSPYFLVPELPRSPPPPATSPSPSLASASVSSATHLEPPSQLTAAATAGPSVVGLSRVAVSGIGLPAAAVTAQPGSGFGTSAAATADDKAKWGRASGAGRGGAERAAEDDSQQDGGGGQADAWETRFDWSQVAVAEALERLREAGERHGSAPRWFLFQHASRAAESSSRSPPAATADGSSEPTSGASTPTPARLHAGNHQRGRHVNHRHRSSSSSISPARGPRPWLPVELVGEGGYGGLDSAVAALIAADADDGGTGSDGAGKTFALVVGTPADVVLAAGAPRSTVVVERSARRSRASAAAAAAVLVRHAVAAAAGAGTATAYDDDGDEELANINPLDILDQFPDTAVYDAVVVVGDGDDDSKPVGVEVALAFDADAWQADADEVFAVHGCVEEWFALDESDDAHGDPAPGARPPRRGRSIKTAAMPPVSPRASIRQDVAALLFDDVWAE